jgi:hypothetical protein
VVGRPDPALWRRAAAAALLILVSGLAVGQAEVDTQTEIQYLLNYVRGSDFVFIRNGKEHEPEEAYKHMKRKGDYYAKKIDSAEEFIEYSATKSTISGKKYTIRLNSGEEVVAQDYLLGVLADYRASE